MFSVLIVEDEILVSIGLKNMIDWGSMDMRVVGEANNGKDGLDLYYREKPDLILTDIKMPVMDGLEMITKIRQADKKTKIIILTSYQEFELVHQALKLSVTDYIVKLKMSPEEMETVIIKVRDELIRESSASGKAESVEELSIIKERLIKDCIMRQSCSDDEFASKVKGLSFRLAPQKMIVCVMKIDSFDQLHKKFDEKHEYSVLTSIVNLINDLLEKYNRGEIVHEQDERFILILSFGDIADESEIKGLFHDIHSSICFVLKNYFNLSVTFGVSSNGDQYCSLKRLYLEASSALEKSYFFPIQKIIYFKEISPYKDHYFAMIDNLHENVMEFPELDVGYLEEVLAGINLLKGMYQNPKSEILELFKSWMHIPSANNNTLDDYMASLTASFRDRIVASQTFEETIQLFVQYLKNVTQKQIGIKRVSKEVSETVKYIKKNYQKNITLGMIAENVELSPSYISILFKKELQINIIDYINRVRIEKAKELLLHTHLKTYEISEKVGFNDESYFSRIFKKITGFRPIEYKKRDIDSFIERQVYDVDE